MSEAAIMGDREPLSDPRDYVLDFSGGMAGNPSPAEGGVSEPSAPPAASSGRPFLSILFRCCGAYARIYKSADGKAYAGHCPKCAKPVRVKIGAGGSNVRFFVAE